MGTRSVVVLDTDFYKSPASPHFLRSLWHLATLNHRWTRRTLLPLRIVRCVHRHTHNFPWSKWEQHFVSGWCKPPAAVGSAEANTPLDLYFTSSPTRHGQCALPSLVQNQILTWKICWHLEHKLQIYKWLCVCCCRIATVLLKHCVCNVATAEGIHNRVICNDP